MVEVGLGLAGGLEFSAPFPEVLLPEPSIVGGFGDVDAPRLLVAGSLLSGGVTSGGWTTDIPGCEGWRSGLLPLSQFQPKMASKASMAIIQMLRGGLLGVETGV